MRPAILATFIALGTLSCPSIVLAIGEGKAAPPIEGQLLDGTRFGYAGKTGKVLIVNFWATWCGPCRQELPALDAFYRQHRDEGLAMLVISMDKPGDLPKAREIAAPFAFPTAAAQDVRFKGFGRIWQLPLTFVIDRDGIVRKDGWTDQSPLDLPVLERVVGPLLRQP